MSKATEDTERPFLKHRVCLGLGKQPDKASESANTDPATVAASALLPLRLPLSPSLSRLRACSNMVALLDGQPLTFSLRTFLEHFVKFRVEVITKRASFELEVAQRRQAIVRGYLAMLEDVPAAIAIIRGAEDGRAAESALMERFALSKPQAEAILAMPLRRLTSMEASKIAEEDARLAATIGGLEGLLGSEQAVLAEVKREALEVVEAHAKEGKEGEGGGGGGGGRRRTTILSSDEGKESALEDLIANEPGVIVVSDKGYIR